MSTEAQRLYELLPAIHRIRDAEIGEIVKSSAIHQAARGPKGRRSDQATAIKATPARAIGRRAVKSFSPPMTKVAAVR